MTIILASCSERPDRADIDPLLTAYYEELQPRLKALEYGNPMSLPVTDALGALIDDLPEDQELLVTSITGKPLTALRASQIIRGIKDRHNKKVDDKPLSVRIRDELRPYDLRGTAATALLRANCSLNEIAVTMGWALRHAANVMERYAALVPEVSDEVHRKLIEACRKSERVESETAAIVRKSDKK